MCMFGCLACFYVAPPGAHEQDVMLLGRDQSANLHIFMMLGSRDSAVVRGVQAP
jgi:hypothetical protein